MITRVLGEVARRISALAAVFVWSVAAAPAATLDFDSLPSGPAGARINLPGVTISETSGGSIFVYNSNDFGMPQGGGFCALRPGFTCLGSARFDFAQPISDLTLWADFVGIGDSARLTAWAGEKLLGGVSIKSNGPVDLSPWDGISRLEMRNIGIPAAKGIAFGKITYTVVPPPAPVPLPASLLGLPTAIAAMTLIGTLRRRSARR